MSIYTAHAPSTRPLLATSPTSPSTSRPAAFSPSSSRQHTTDNISSSSSSSITTTTAKHKERRSPKMPPSLSSSSTSASSSSSSGRKQHRSHHTKSHSSPRHAPAPVQVVVQPPQQAGRGTALAPPTVVRLTDQDTVQRHVSQQASLFAVAQLYRLYDNQQVSDPGALQGTLSRSVSMLDNGSGGGGSGSGSSSSSSSSRATRKSAYFLFDDLRVNTPGDYYLCIQVYYFWPDQRITVSVGYAFTHPIRVLESPAAVPSGRTLSAYEANLLNAIQNAGQM